MGSLYLILRVVFSLSLYLEMTSNVDGITILESLCGFTNGVIYDGNCYWLTQAQQSQENCSEECNAVFNEWEATYGYSFSAEEPQSHADLAYGQNTSIMFEAFNRLVQSENSTTNISEAFVGYTWRNQTIYNLNDSAVLSDHREELLGLQLPYPKCATLNRELNLHWGSCYENRSAICECTGGNYTQLQSTYPYYEVGTPNRTFLLLLTNVQASAFLANETCDNLADGCHLLTLTIVDYLSEAGNFLSNYSSTTNSEEHEVYIGYKWEGGVIESFDDRDVPLSVMSHLLQSVGSCMVVREQTLDTTSCSGLHRGLCMVNENKISMTPSMSTAAPANCRCLCSEPVSQSQIEEKVFLIKKALSLNTRKLSSFQRRYKSADDARVSSGVMGVTAGVVIFGILFLIVLSDLMSLKKYLSYNSGIRRIWRKM